MAEKILKMLRQQKTQIGHLQFGVAYRFDMGNAEHADTAKTLLEREFAEETSEKELADAKVKAESLAAPKAAKGGKKKGGSAKPEQAAPDAAADATVTTEG